MIQITAQMRVLGAIEPVNGRKVPVECRHVLEQLGEVYRNDARARHSADG